MRYYIKEYLNQKYEIAAGAAGPVEFVIPQNISL